MGADGQQHVGVESRRRDGLLQAHHQVEFFHGLDLLVDVGELVQPVRALPEDAAYVGHYAVQFVVARPQARLLAGHVGVVVDDVGPAVRLDGGKPDVGVLVVGIGHGLGVPALTDALGAAAEDADVAGHGL